MESIFSLAARRAAPTEGTPKFWGRSPFWKAVLGVCEVVDRDREYQHAAALENVANMRVGAA